MYLRTTRRKNKDGSVVSYYQLAHNDWDPQKGRSKVRILHNFGRADQVEREALVRLCGSIARACGCEVRDLTTEGVDPEEERDRVDLIETRELGVPWVAEALWRELGLGTVLRQLCADVDVQVPYERALFAMVANRLSRPTSKLGLCERWQGRAWLPGVEGGLTPDQCYRAMDLLYEHAEQVEEAVFSSVANLFNLSVDLVFFDTTTASFHTDEIDGDDPETGEPGLRRYGYSKEGHWAPQVVVGLAVTREGFPVRSWVFPGNTVDSTVVERIRADLRGWKLHRVLMVGDAGMDSTENRELVARAAGRYVFAVRSHRLAEVRKDVLTRAGRYREVAENLRVKEVVVGEGEKRRRYIVCHNPRQAEREKKHRAQVLEELEAELARHTDRSADRKWVAQLRASGRYGRYLKLDRRGQLVLDRKAAKEAEKRDGKWVLVTNDDSLSPEEAAQTYKALAVIERCFRSLKRSQIRLTPMFHRAERRIVAHVKLCVLALLLQRVAEHRTGLPWPRIRHALEGLQATCYETQTHHFWQRNRLPGGLNELMEKLEVPPPKRVLAVAER